MAPISPTALSILAIQHDFQDVISDALASSSSSSTTTAVNGMNGHQNGISSSPSRSPPLPASGTEEKFWLSAYETGKQSVHGNAWVKGDRSSRGGWGFGSSSEFGLVRDEVGSSQSLIGEKPKLTGTPRTITRTKLVAPRSVLRIEHCACPGWLFRVLLSREHHRTPRTKWITGRHRPLHYHHRRSPRSTSPPTEPASPPATKTAPSKSTPSPLSLPLLETRLPHLQEP